MSDHRSTESLVYAYLDVMASGKSLRVTHAACDSVTVVSHCHTSMRNKTYTHIHAAGSEMINCGLLPIHSYSSFIVSQITINRGENNTRIPAKHTVKLMNLFLDRCESKCHDIHDDVNNNNNNNLSLAPNQSQSYQFTRQFRRHIQRFFHDSIARWVIAQAHTARAPYHTIDGENPIRKLMKLVEGTTKTIVDEPKPFEHTYLWYLVAKCINRCAIDGSSIGNWNRIGIMCSFNRR